MAVFVLKKDASEYRIYQPVAYQGITPTLPLWQVHVLRKSLLNTGQVYIGEVWGWTAPYCCAFTRTTATTYRIGYGAPDGGNVIQDWIQYDRNGNASDLADDWQSTSTTFGVDDGEGPSDSTRHARTDSGASSNGCYAEITVVVPSDWAGATLDMNAAFDSLNNTPGAARFTLYYNDSGTYRQIPLNGRGAMSNQWGLNGTNLAIASLRYVQVWDVNGTTDMAQTAGDCNCNLEMARHLKPGTYKLRTTLLVAAKRINCGRVRLHREDRNIIPTDTDAFEYFSEYATDISSSPLRPGPTLANWSSSLDLEIKHNSDSQYANGPNYGFNRQTSMTLTGDGADLTGITIGTFYGPYTSVVFAPTDNITRTSSSIGASNATVVQNVADMILSGGPTLTADMVGDFISLGSRTDGIDGGKWFEITGVVDGTDTVTVSPTPTAAGAVEVASIHSNYVSVAKVYTFSAKKMRFVATMDWLKDSLIARLYIGNWRPFSNKETQNWYYYIPRHPIGVMPYLGTQVDFLNNRLGLSGWSHKMTEPLDKTQTYTQKVSGSNASINGTSTVQFPGSTDLSTVVAGDALILKTRTDGLGQSHMFQILTVTDGSDQVTVSPTPGTASGLAWNIGGIRPNYDTTTMQDITNLVTDRRVFHYDRIEQNQMRSVGRIVIVDSDWWNWVGGNFLTGGVGCFGSGSEDYKSYNTAIVSQTQTAAGANSVYSFEVMVAERAYLDIDDAGGIGTSRKIIVC